MSINTAAIPDSLKAKPNWVAWRYEDRDGKRTKVLYSNGRRARSNDPQTWLSFDAAYQQYSADQQTYAGIGFVFTPPMFGIDMDSCIKPDGSLTSWASTVLEHCPSYCEVSPSGVGLKIIGIGELPIPMHKQDGSLNCGRNFAGDKFNLEPATPDKKSEVLIYRQKFFTITGSVYQQYGEVQECPGVAELFYWLQGQAPQRPKVPSQIIDQAHDRRTDHGRTEAEDRIKAAISAMLKVSVPTSENDGSNRLMSYARQAKRFIVDRGDALRAIRAVEQVNPFPIALSDDDILRRLNEADVQPGEAFLPRSCDGVDLSRVLTQPVGPAGQTQQADHTPAPDQQPPTTKPPEPTTKPAEAFLESWLLRVKQGNQPQLIKQPGALKGIEIGPEMITVLGAPPGAGKTALVMQVMFDALALDSSLKAVVANAETTFEVLIRREITRLTWLPKIGCLDSNLIRFGPLTEHDLQRVNSAANELAPRLERVEVLCEPCNVLQLAKLRDDTPGLLIVDYLQKFAPSDKDPRAGVNEVMATLRMLAKLGWSVVALSATKRDPNGKHSAKELSLSSFRESGEVEYNADSAYVLQDNGALEQPYIRHVTLGHVKNRHGALDSRQLRFDMPRMQFTVLEPAPAAEPSRYSEFDRHSRREAVEEFF